MGPVEGGEGADAPGLGEECVPGRAGWHIAAKLIVPDNLTPVFLPPYSPELNAIERVWLYLRERFLSHRRGPGYDDWLSSSSIACMAAAPTVGRTRATPVSRSGQTATEQVDRLVTLIPLAARTHAFLEPAPPDPPGLTDARFVEEPDFDVLSWRPQLVDQSRELFLNAACALRSASG